MFGLIYTYTPLKFFVEPFWRDEAFSYVLANKNIIDILFFTAKDFNPPLYYIILHYWMMIFGSSEIALRTVSLLFYWGTMYILFDSMLDLFKFSYKKAAIYLLLFIINPVLCFYAFEARMYTQMSFLAALSFYSLFTNKKRLHLFSLVFGLYTHYFMVFVWLMQYIIVITKGKLIGDRPQIRKSLNIAAIAFLPWCLFVASQKNLSSSEFWINKVRLVDIFNMPAIMYTGTEPYLEYFKQQEKLFLLPLTFLSLLIYIILTTGWLKKKSEIFGHLLLWGLSVPAILVVISLFKPLFLPRYLLFCVPGLLLSLAYSIDIMRRKAKLLFFTLLTVMTLLLLGMQISYRNRGRDKHIESLKIIAATAKSRDVVYVESSLDYFTACYYFDEKRTYVSGITHDEFRTYNGKALIPKEKFATEPPFFPAKAYVLKEDGTYEVNVAY